MTDEYDENAQAGDSARHGRQEYSQPASAFSDAEPSGPKRPWKSIAVLIGGGLVIAAAASVVTLAVTHNSAVAENAHAYVNGLTDGLNANARSYITALVDGLDLPGSDL